jgi:hypothetical protein
MLIKKVNLFVKTNVAFLNLNLVWDKLTIHFLLFYLFQYETKTLVNNLTSFSVFAWCYIESSRGWEGLFTFALGTSESKYICSRKFWKSSILGVLGAKTKIYEKKVNSSESVPPKAYKV